MRRKMQCLVVISPGKKSAQVENNEQQDGEIYY